MDMKEPGGSGDAEAAISAMAVPRQTRERELERE